jgi:ferric-dicitrate binding protein FerR (iron transport regulator)
MEKLNNIQLLERFFDGAATKQEVQHLLDQVKNTEFEKAWMKDQWESSKEKMNPVVQKQIFESIKQRIEPRQSFNWKQWIAVAASIVVICTTCLSGYLLFKDSHNNLLGDMKVAVEKGQKAALTLPDGSKVWINSGSIITYGSRYNQKERIINLDGEAYFEVAKNKNAPFIVQSHSFSVRALGTAFDVKAYSEEKTFSTVLVHGKVEVSDELNKIDLTPNQKVIYNRTTQSMQKTDVDDSNTYAAWRNNQLTFDSETFENIALALERSYNVKLIFQSESLKNYHYSGLLDNTSLESILQLFAMTSPLSYKMQGSTIYLSENKKMANVYKNVMK